MGKKRDKRHKYSDTKHHLRCRSNGGTNEASNIVYIPEDKHRAWHLLFGNMEAPEIAAVINRMYLDPAWRLKAVRALTDKDDGNML